MHIAAWARSILTPVRCLVDACYPGVCARCEAFCDAAGPLCDACDAELEALAARPACPRCAKPVPQEGAPCPRCTGEGLYPFERIVRLGTYDEPLRSLIHAMKYHKRWALADYLADRLLRKREVRELLEGKDLLVAVPLHWWKRLTRGYNQSHLLAARLRRGPEIALGRPIRRTRPTESQTLQLSRSARKENVKGAFHLRRPLIVTGQHVILVDDVTTSGATLQEAARALLKAKPASISAIVLAVADPQGSGFTAV